MIPCIDADFINKHNNYKSLVNALKLGFASETISVPERHHHDFELEKAAQPATLLLMPAWQKSGLLGVKVVTVHPENSRHQLPTVQGVYVLQDAQTGQMLATLDAQELTAKRTAAASALAADYLTRADATSLLLLGTGVLSSQIIEAYLAVRPLQQIYIWGRNFDKAQQVASDLSKKLSAQSSASSAKITAIEDYKKTMSEVDIVASVTASTEPLVFGDKIRAGQHVDLIGAYRTDMRESDDALIQKAKIYVDTLSGGLQGSGDIALPLESGAISRASIAGDLHGLTREQIKGRESADEITVFKSVGHALEDLVAAEYFWNQFQQLGSGEKR